MRDHAETGRDLEFRSTVPEFLATRFHLDTAEGSYDMLEVACPRTDCKRSFWVSGSWKAPVEGRVNTRPCPWCFKVSWLPGQKPVEPGQPAARGRRVVKRRKGAKS